SEHQLSNFGSGLTVSPKITGKSESKLGRGGPGRTRTSHQTVKARRQRQRVNTGRAGAGVLPPSQCFVSTLVLLVMQLPCRIFCSAWHPVWRANCSYIA